MRQERLTFDEVRIRKLPSGGFVLSAPAPERGPGGVDLVASDTLGGIANALEDSNTERGFRFD